MWNISFERGTINESTILADLRGLKDPDGNHVFYVTEFDSKKNFYIGLVNDPFLPQWNMLKNNISNKYMFFGHISPNTRTIPFPKF